MNAEIQNWFVLTRYNVFRHAIPPMYFFHLAKDLVTRSCKERPRLIPNLNTPSIALLHLATFRHDDPYPHMRETEVLWFSMMLLVFFKMKNLSLNSD